jgi:type I restriction enzyme M protein
MDGRNLAEVRRTLWTAADQLRANSTLAPSEYRRPVLGLIRPEVEATATARRPVTADDYKARSVVFVPGRRSTVAPRPAP